jgi:Tfp pilus assembly protein FimV
MKNFFMNLRLVLCSAALSLTTANAHAVISIGNLTVQSFRNETLQAYAEIRTGAGEAITQQCLSLGKPDTEAENKLPYLTDATVSLDTRDGKQTVSVTTAQPMSDNGFNLLLNVQCPGQLQVSRDFTVLLGTRSGNVLTVPAQPETAPPEAIPLTGTQPKGGGVYWSMRSGDTLAGIAQKIYPKEPIYQKKMVWAIVQYNPQVFPNGKPDEPPTGTVIIIPDLRSVPAVKVPGEAGSGKTRKSSARKAKPSEAKSEAAENPAQTQQPGEKTQ